MSHPDAHRFVKMTHVRTPSGEVYGSTLRDPEAEATRLRRAGFNVSIVGNIVHIHNHLSDEKAAT